MNRTSKQHAAMTTAGLNLIAQALSIYDNDLRLAVCNRRFQEMFNLPDHLTEPGASFAETIRFLAENGEYAPETDIEAIVQSRVDQALNFVPHYLERERPNGQVISVEGSPLPQGGWVTVYTDISRTKGVEQLLRSRSEELTEKLIAHTEELSAANRQLAATNTALEEAKRQLTEIEGRTRLTTEMMPAHIAHVDAEGYYTYTNRRLSSVFPSRPSEILACILPRPWERPPLNGSSRICWPPTRAAARCLNSPKATAAAVSVLPSPRTSTAASISCRWM